MYILYADVTQPMIRGPVLGSPRRQRFIFIFFLNFD